jgi:hypothetical protein
MPSLCPYDMLSCSLYVCGSSLGTAGQTGQTWRPRYLPPGVCTMVWPVNSKRNQKGSTCRREVGFHRLRGRNQREARMKREGRGRNGRGACQCCIVAGVHKGAVAGAGLDGNRNEKKNKMNMCDNGDKPKVYLIKTIQTSLLLVGFFLLVREKGTAKCGLT